MANNTLFIPGGAGTRALVDDVQTIDLLRELTLKSTYTLSVCTGSALLAKTGLLKNINATSNKKAWEWVGSIDEDVKWQKSARWCVDGKFYTSSGVSAGIDMSLGFVKDLYGEQKAEDIAKHIEYIWNKDSTNDPFAVS